ncbi:MAG: D-aminoacyl-tRNA deacylase [Chitinivorax sp.]|jgi:D-tyrosyl-tRNA(Tyr) deacylase
MRVLLQRVSQAAVNVEGEVVGQIGQGLLALVGIEADDTPADIDWLCRKIVALRIFNDDAGKMNRSVLDIDGNILAISQFTLHASTKKGTRPSYSRAARPDFAQPMYHAFLEALSTALGKPVQQGIFGADMQVSLVNDGPVTIWLDSKAPE